MAKLKFAYPIEEVHGKLKGTFGAAITAGDKNGNKFYHSTIYGKRIAEVGADELANRLKFKAIAAAVKLRRNTQSQRVTDQAAFKAQSTYKTMQSYLWSICKAAYDAEHQDD